MIKNECQRSNSAFLIKGCSITSLALSLSLGFFRTNFYMKSIAVFDISSGKVKLCCSTYIMYDLHSGSSSLSPSDSRDRKELFQSIARRSKLPSTKGQQSYRIPLLQESLEEHSQKFHNRSFSDQCKLQPTQNHTICKHSSYLHSYISNDYILRLYISMHYSSIM